MLCISRLIFTAEADEAQQAPDVFFAIVVAAVSTNEDTMLLALG